MTALQTHLRRNSLVLALVFLAGCAGASDTPTKFEPAPTSYYTLPVEKGESLKDIASRYQVREEDLLALNDLYDRNAVVKGTTIRVPAYGRLREASLTTTEVPVSRDEDSPRPLASSRPAKIEKTPIPEPKPTTQKAKPDESWLSWMMPSSDTPPLSERLVWPVKGRLLSSFGAGSNGARNDGINISASRGAPVHAAAAGTVTYVGDELKAYGNLVLIRHDNGFITAYAHCDKINVARGERVTSGQVIASVGATGDVDQPQVHFELRQGTKPVDPAPYLVAAN
jgi:murein DD-endopeptidase MepM/ murein hydrolase activator NlpD